MVVANSNSEPAAVEKCFGFRLGRPILPQSTRPRLANPNRTCAKTIRCGARFGRASGNSPEVQPHQNFKTRSQSERQCVDAGQSCGQGVWWARQRRAQFPATMTVANSNSESAAVAKNVLALSLVNPSNLSQRAQDFPNLHNIFAKPNRTYAQTRQTVPRLGPVSGKSPGAKLYQNPKATAMFKGGVLQATW